MFQKYSNILLKEQITQYYPQDAKNGFHLFQQLLLATASFSKYEFLFPKPLHKTMQHALKMKLIQEYKKYFSIYKTRLISLLKKEFKNKWSETEMFETIISDDYVLHKLDFLLLAALFKIPLVIKGCNCKEMPFECKEEEKKEEKEEEKKEQEEKEQEEKEKEKKEEEEKEQEEKEQEEKESTGYFYFILDTVEIRNGCKQYKVSVKNEIKEQEYKKKIPKIRNFFGPCICISKQSKKNKKKYLKEKKTETYFKFSAKLKNLKQYE